MHGILQSLNPAAVTFYKNALFDVPAMLVFLATIDLFFYELRPGELNPNVFIAIKAGYITSVVVYINYFWKYVGDKSYEYFLLINS